MNRYGARKTFIWSIVYMILVTLVAVVILCGPRCRDLVFVFCPFWGFGFGVFYASNNAYWTELVPPDSTAQFMSLYYLAANILGWAPPAAYALLNQLLKETHLSLVVTCFWCAVALPFLRAAGQGDAPPKEDATDGLIHLSPQANLADVNLADKSDSESSSNGGL